MRWVVFAIAVISIGVLAALWRSGGEGSIPMLLIALALVLFFAILPLALSKRKPRPDPSSTIKIAPEETRPDDR